MDGHRTTIITAVIVAVLSIVGIGAAAELELGAGQPAEPKPVISAGAKTVRSGGTFDIIADFKLDKTVHLYKDKLGIKWTNLKGASYSKLVLPKPETINDPLSDDPRATIDVYTGDVKIIGRLTATAKPGEQIILEGKFLHQSCTDKICFPPAQEPFALKLVAGQSAGPLSAAASASASEDRPAETTRPAAVETQTKPKVTGLAFFLEILGAFVWGIAIGFTPCVYPMIPITAAIIGAKKDRGLLPALRASMTYVLGMSLVYAVLGLVASSMGTVVGTTINAWYVVVPIAVLFVILAVTMLAGWNFALPSGFTTKLQGALAGKKGIFTIFLLGAVGGLVAGPCVLAPLLALLDRVFSAGQAALGFWALFAAAWGMGVPLIIFSTASGALPKAGPWMEWVKRLLGFVLLWAALYFLRNLIGDIAYDLGSAVLLVIGAVFMGGLDVLTKDSTSGDKIKKVLGAAAILGAAVLAVGLVIPKPPVKKVIFVPGSMQDVDKALARGDRILLDFYATWCVTCKALDKKVYNKPTAIEAAGGITGLKIDVDKYPEVAKRYGVKGPPTLLFIGADGKVRKDLSFVGMKSLDEFVKLLQEFKK